MPSRVYMLPYMRVLAFDKTRRQVNTTNELAHNKHVQQGTIELKQRSLHAGNEMLDHVTSS